jgi:hypothetical protein
MGKNHSLLADTPFRIVAGLAGSTGIVLLSEEFAARIAAGN